MLWLRCPQTCPRSQGYERFSSGFFANVWLGVPHLPSTSQPLRESLTRNREYVNLLVDVSERLGELIRRARDDGDIAARFSEAFLLYHFYSRSCDPTLEYLRAGGTLSDEEIVEHMVAATFEGLTR